MFCLQTSVCHGHLEDSVMKPNIHWRNHGQE